MIVQEALKIRWLKVLICIMLCITSTTLTFFIQYQEVCAILPAIIPIGIGILAGAALLTACGLSFTSESQCKGTATDLINKMNDYIVGNPGNPISFALVHDIASWNDPFEQASLNIVGDLTWEFVKDYLYDNFSDVTPVDDGSGTMVMDKVLDNPRVFYSDIFGGLVYWNSTGQTTEETIESAYGLAVYESLDIGTHIVTYEYEGSGTSSGVPYDKYRAKKVKKETGEITYYTQNSMYVFEGDPPPGFICYTVTGGEAYARLVYYGHYAGNPNERKWQRFSTAPSWGIDLQLGMESELTAIKAGLQTAVRGYDAAINNPAHDTYISEDDVRVIYVPQGATTATYVNNSYTNIYNETADAVAGGATVETDPDTWWEVAGAGITNGIYQLGQLLVGTLAQLKAAVEALAAPIVSAISNAVAAVQEKIAEGQQSIDPQMSGFKFFDLFVIFFDVLIACIALVARACLYLATIVTIPADGSIFNDATLSGLNFFKNQNIPVVNVSMWNMFSGLMTLVISLSVVKKVRSTHT